MKASLRYGIAFKFFLIAFGSVRSQDSYEKLYFDRGLIREFDHEVFYFTVRNNSSKIAFLKLLDCSENLEVKFKADTFSPGRTDSIRVSLFPDFTGIFKERFILQLGDEDPQTFTVEAQIKSFSKQYGSTTQQNKLMSDKEITFLIVDSRTERNIPNAKVYITNEQNGKSYIGYADEYGVLKNHIPEGTYNIVCLTKGYNYQIKTAKTDLDRNLAVIELEKTIIEPPKKDTIIQKVDSFISSSPIPVQPDVAKLDPVINIEDLPAASNDNLATSSIPQIETDKNSATKDPLSEISKSKEEAIESRTPLNIILLIDNSSSMQKVSKFESLKASIKNLIENYSTRDYLTVLTFNDEVNTIVPTTQIKDKTYYFEKIDLIEAKGRTDGSAGVHKALNLMDEIAKENYLNMVVLATDGNIANSRSAEDRIMEKISAMNSKGRLFSILGYGTYEGIHRKMQRLADAGGGLYLNMNIYKNNNNSILLDEIYSTLLKIDK